MDAAIDQRHRQEVKDAYAAVSRLQLAAKISALIGGLAFLWTLFEIVLGDIDTAEGIVLLAGTALGTIVPAAGLYAASYRTSLGAARLERALEQP